MVGIVVSAAVALYVVLPACYLCWRSGQDDTSTARRLLRALAKWSLILSPPMFGVTGYLISRMPQLLWEDVLGMVGMVTAVVVVKAVAEVKRGPELWWSRKRWPGPGLDDAAKGGGRVARHG